MEAGGVLEGSGVQLEGGMLYMTRGHGRAFAWLVGCIMSLWLHCGKRLNCGGVHVEE